jgi:hypothetical protein
MTTTVFLPVPTQFDVLTTPLHRLDAVKGNAFAILNNGWACMDELTIQLENQLRAAGATDIFHFRTPHAQPSADEYLDDIASKVAGAITGLGN